MMLITIITAVIFQFLLQQSNIRKPIDLSDKALEKYPDDYRLLLSKISILQCKKRYKEAEEITNRLLAVDSEDPYSIFMKLLCIQIVLKKKEIITK